jgi:hypothetical protein
MPDPRPPSRPPQASIKHRSVAPRGPEFRWSVSDQSRVQGQGVVVALSPLAKVLFDSLEQRMYNLPNKAHRLPLSI